MAANSIPGEGEHAVNTEGIPGVVNLMENEDLTTEEFEDSQSEAEVEAPEPTDEHGGPTVIQIMVKLNNLEEKYDTALKNLKNSVTDLKQQQQRMIHIVLPENRLLCMQHGPVNVSG